MPLRGLTYHAYYDLSCVERWVGYRSIPCALEHPCALVRAQVLYLRRLQLGTARCYLQLTESSAHQPGRSFRAISSHDCHLPDDSTRNTGRCSGSAETMRIAAGSRARTRALSLGRAPTALPEPPVEPATTTLNGGENVSLNFGRGRNGFQMKGVQNKEQEMS